ncbi:hypothetical protein CAPTEDRAFT_209096 [Capitella teleta]|uniref:Uncharacterized protein n=1 Tax=Capitella teleta TaxID=283909 RepID=R7UKU8_CAPTE|nr:hypothetical protein CAPTEDRAFT_209096 [Capitella teleta]|eukprot:ELU06723.1 hypothetical protein CAPTEDRAFT_209096 [Capitella teleta]
MNQAPDGPAQKAMRQPIDALPVRSKEAHASERKETHHQAHPLMGERTQRTQGTEDCEDVEGTGDSEKSSSELGRLSAVGRMRRSWRHKETLATFELRQRHNTMPFVLIITLSISSCHYRSSATFVARIIHITKSLCHRSLGADMQNYIHAFQVSTTSTCIFNDSSAAFITFYPPSRKLRAHEAATRGRPLLLIARTIVDYVIILYSPIITPSCADSPTGKITRLGCGESNTNKTVCNSLLELMTVSAQLGFNSWGFNNSMHCYLQKKINSSSTSLDEVGHCSRRSSILRSP